MFEYRGVGYDLPMTFQIYHDEDSHRSNSTWYFTISLGEPWKERGSDCFKLIAGALEAPT